MIKIEKKKPAKYTIESYNEDYEFLINAIDELYQLENVPSETLSKMREIINFYYYKPLTYKEMFMEFLKTAGVLKAVWIIIIFLLASFLFPNEIGKLIDKFL